MVLAVSRQFSAKFNTSLGGKLVLLIPQERKSISMHRSCPRPLGQKMAISHEREFDALRWPPGGRGYLAARYGSKGPTSLVQKKGRIGPPRPQARITPVERRYR